MKISIDGDEFEYDTGKLLNTEAIALQKATGMRPPEFGKALEAGDAIAITGLVWLLWMRNGKRVKFDTVEFDLASIEIEDDEADADEATDPKETSPEG